MAGEYAGIDRRARVQRGPLGTSGKGSHFLRCICRTWKEYARADKLGDRKNMSMLYKKGELAIAQNARLIDSKISMRLKLCWRV